MHCNMFHLCNEYIPFHNFSPLISKIHTHIKTLINRYIHSKLTKDTDVLVMYNSCL